MNVKVKQGLVADKVVALSAYLQQHRSERMPCQDQML